MTKQKRQWLSSKKRDTDFIFCYVSTKKEKYLDHVLCGDISLSVQDQNPIKLDFCAKNKTEAKARLKKLQIVIDYFNKALVDIDFLNAQKKEYFKEEEVTRTHIGETLNKDGGFAFIMLESAGFYGSKAYAWANIRIADCSRTSSDFYIDERQDVKIVLKLIECLEEFKSTYQQAMKEI